MFSKIKTTIFIILFILSCQPVELIKPTEIDNSRLKKISINSKQISLIDSYNPVFSEDNIEDQIETSPLELVKSWISENISNFGNENKFTINILDASIFKKEINNTQATKYEEKTIFKYEVFFLVQYELYDDSGYLIANTIVESSRSTTSKKYISLNETDLIVNDLLLNALKDFTNETDILLNKYMNEYL